MEAMSTHYTSWVWAESKTQGSHKLALLALADCAGRDGEVSLSQRDVAQLCGLSKSRAEEIIKDLINGGELSVIAHGAGRSNPTRYKIMADQSGKKCPVSEGRHSAPANPAPAIGPMPRPDVSLPPMAAEPKPEPIPAPVTPKPVYDVPAHLPQNAVGMALVKAGVEIDPMAGLYWFRREHADDLAELAKHFTNMDELWVALESVAPVGPIRRLTQLEGRARGART